jgi:hypothetical protein
LLARIRSAESDRRVTLRPAPDTMSLLSGLLPVTQGVAVHASLARQADSLRASGDARSRGQIMADTLVERVTGQAAADAVTVEVNLVMTDQTLFNLASGQRPDSGGTGHEAGVPSAGADEPAMVQGYGPVPAEFARRLLNPTEVADGAPTGAGDAGKVTAWLRRLYAHPPAGSWSPWSPRVAPSREGCAGC